MDTTFEVADPHDDAHGDYLSFMIRDGTRMIPGRISGPAMQILGNDSGYSAAEIFSANKAKIRTAAYKSRRFNPTLLVVVLGIADFS